MNSGIFKAIVIVLIGTSSVIARAESGGTPRTVSTSGEATVNVVPDEISVQIGVVTFNADIERAKSESDEKAKRLLAAVKALGVEDKHIQTSATQLELSYNRPEQHELVSGYRVRRTYAITLKDPSKLEALFDATVKNGANLIMGVDFRTTELRKHRDEARKLAIVAAREKAEQLADALDCKIGAPRSISEGGGFYGYWGGRWGSGMMTQNVVQDHGGASADGGEASPLGQMGIQASVNVVFDLLPNETTK